MRKIVQEFKSFISRGNVIDMAVGIIIGSAFTNIVNSLVNDIFMQVVTFITGKMDFAELVIPLGSSAGIKIGNFLSSVISFLLVAVAVFFMVKGINKIRDIAGKKSAETKSAEKECPYCKTSIAAEAIRCPHCTSTLEEETEPNLQIPDPQ